MPTRFPRGRTAASLGALFGALFACLPVLPAAAATIYPDIGALGGAVAMSWGPDGSGMVTTMTTTRGAIETVRGTLSGGLRVPTHRDVIVIWNEGDTDNDTGFEFTLDKYDLGGSLTNSVSWTVRHCTKLHPRTGAVMLDDERRDCPEVELGSPHHRGAGFHWRLVGWDGSYRVFEEGSPNPVRGRIDTRPGDYVFSVIPTDSGSSGTVAINIASAPLPGGAWLLASGLGAGALLARRRRRA